MICPPTAIIKNAGSAAQGVNAMSPSFNARVEKTFRRDKKLAVSFLLFLWLVVLFVLLSVLAQLSHQTETWVLVVAAGMILLFNTASIIAMLRHYAEDRDFI